MSEVIEYGPDQMCYQADDDRPHVLLELHDQGVVVRARIPLRFSKFLARYLENMHGTVYRTLNPA